ncbi:unnamed protein product [Didymodactylos carnosus]|uniref:RRM domain-containing protein n=1 Tax=Didymodactylos carnosus TaxID=1234261 RepID=A0A813NZ48_9BILA|nr:unnamed protein product [Didymodactylos carnosus]CAF0924018.1 unnamed protein product [Didymodactylos carnosus]CAF3521214.1 unnamed protein product [Didymodactylos carnosus]CAF3701251.1 unnamed protein product [Didymodactylos carnosus]
MSNEKSQTVTPSSSSPTLSNTNDQQQIQSLSAVNGTGGGGSSSGGRGDHDFMIQTTTNNNHNNFSHSTSSLLHHNGMSEFSSSTWNNEALNNRSNNSLLSVNLNEGNNIGHTLDALVPLAHTLNNNNTNGRIFSPSSALQQIPPTQTSPPPSLMNIHNGTNGQMTFQQQQQAAQAALQRRAITASHNFPAATVNPRPMTKNQQQSQMWNNQPVTSIMNNNIQQHWQGAQPTSMPLPPHMQQTMTNGANNTWGSANNGTNTMHGFPATSSRRPVPSLTNPINSSAMMSGNVNNINGGMPNAQNINNLQQKKSTQPSQNNFLPFLPSMQNKYNSQQQPQQQSSIRRPMIPHNYNSQTNSNLRYQSNNTNNNNLLDLNEQHLMNGGSTMNSEDNNSAFPSMNSGGAYDMSSFHQLMDMMRNVNTDGNNEFKCKSYVKRVYSDDSGMGSILDTESLISVGGGGGAPASGLFGSPRNIVDMNKEERFSRKVFVGGLPPDIDEEEIIAHFQRFGPLMVDWPHKQESKSYFPPKGYAFLIFTCERSVQELIDECVMDDGKLYMCVSSPSMKDKAVQIRPWLLADSDFVMDGSQPLDPRKTIFVGGVPRPLRAVELAMIMDRLYGGVCYAGIDTDPELKYPKGAGRVAFSNQQSYIAAISARFVQLQHGDIDKRVNNVEVKPYVLDDQMCDECQGARCGGKFAPFFCANVTCLQYYCETCWASIHARSGREYHKPLVKEGADRPRTLPFRW